MAGKFRRAFFAYPGEPYDLVSPISAAADLLKKTDAPIALEIWPELDIFGAHIPDVVRDNIRQADIVFCDVTRANMNVYYEAGYAIGLGKTVAPVINSSFANAVSDIQRDGIFDTVGYKTYENSEQLAHLVINAPINSLTNLYAKPINFQQPLFLLSAYRKTDFINAITSAIKESKVFFRSFDPAEIPRFSTIPIISDATASAGIIIPLLAEHIDDAPRHNLRAAFLAGLSHGLDRQTLLLQLQSRERVGPADYREFIVSVKDGRDISELVNEFAKSAIVAAQSIKPAVSRRDATALQKLTLGASAAENEFRTLESYFVETAEFARTVRGEVGVVAGRKGSGKTAIFFMVRDKFRDKKNSVVTDLKPESHQLSLFREQLLKIVDLGVFDHTLAAFWYFLILSEILLTVQRNYEHRSKIDGNAYEAATEIRAALGRFEVSESGDFTARINRLGSYILQEVERAQKSREQLSPERLTNIIFRGGIAEIKALLQKHTNNHTEIVLLFDNIDKGWPTNGVDTFDVRLVRLLVETLDKIRRDFDSQDRDFMSVVFLRNDIYELLVEETPDRGKSDRIRIDWTDRAKLRQVIYRRLQSSLGGSKQSFDELWSRFFTPKVGERDSFDYFVDHCLMRPRFLINIVEYAIGNAINRGHDRVEPDDCEDAVKQHSNYLIDDFGYEMRDVSGVSAEILYSLVGVTKLLTKEEVIDRFDKFSIPKDKTEEAFKLMLWYGVLGIVTKDGRERFIYDYEYNLKRLEAEVRTTGTDILYVTNAALHVALSG